MLIWHLPCGCPRMYNACNRMQELLPSDLEVVKSGVLRRFNSSSTGSWFRYWRSARTDTPVSETSMERMHWCPSSPCSDFKGLLARLIDTRSFSSRMPGSCRNSQKRSAVHTHTHQYIYTHTHLLIYIYSMDAWALQKFSNRSAVHTHTPVYVYTYTFHDIYLQHRCRGPAEILKKVSYKKLYPLLESLRDGVF